MGVGQWNDITLLPRSQLADGLDWDLTCDSTNGMRNYPGQGQCDGVAIIISMLVDLGWGFLFVLAPRGMREP